MRGAWSPIRLGLCLGPGGPAPDAARVTFLVSFHRWKLSVYTKFWTYPDQPA
jgi:hypothetical protein